MLLLVCYILCNLNCSPLKSSVNLLNKAKEILEVYSCSFPGCLKPESYPCPPEKLLIPMLVPTEAFTKWGPGELTWDRLRSALSQSFGSNSDPEHTGKYCSESPGTFRQTVP